MKPEVRVERHLSGFYFVAHQLQVILLVVLAVPSPFREVQVIAAIVDVADDEPWQSLQERSRIAATSGVSCVRA